MSYDFNNNNNQNHHEDGSYNNQQSNDYYRYPNPQPYNYYKPEPAVHNSTPNYQAAPPAPPPPPKKDRTEKKGGKAVTYVASLLAVAVISGVTGGAAGYLASSNNIQPSLEASSSSESEVPSSSSEFTPPVISSGSTAGSLSGVVEKAAVSVVAIDVQVKSTNPFYGDMASEGSGSGVILTSDGYIATNNHVIEGASSITVRTRDGSEFPAVMIGTDSQTDLAVIKIEAEGLIPATFADSDSLQVGETAVAIGNPLGTLGGTVTDGIISAKDREITIDDQTMTLLQTSAAVNRGNSGGGLFDANGNLVGIVNAKSSGNGVEGLGFAIPSNRVKEVTGDIIENGYVTGRPELGIKVLPITDAQTAFMYRVNELGIYVASTTKENGLQPGDLIVSIDGAKIESYADIKSALDGQSVGDVLEFVVKRDGKSITVQVPLTERVPEYMTERSSGNPM